MTLPPTGRPVRHGRAVLAVAAWVLGFGLSVRLAGLGLPPAETPAYVRERLTHLAAHGDEYDAIFIGSSRIKNHIMPAVFDRLAGAGGRPMKSFNAGVHGMAVPEDAWMLEQILAGRPARLRWVFLEIDFFQTAIKDGEKGTLRSVAWHDWPRFWSLCRRLTAMTGHLSLRDQIVECFERPRDFICHLSAFGQRATQFGRGALLFEKWRGAAELESEGGSKLGPGGDGWEPAKGGDAGEVKSAKRSGKSAGPRDVPKPDEADRVSQAVLGEAIAQIERAGAVPILIIPPRVRVWYFVPSAENARRAAVINLCDPAAYPQLYAPEYRIDTSHLNAAGAEVFTRIVADRFLEIARQPPGAH